MLDLDMVISVNFDPFFKFIFGMAAMPVERCAARLNLNQVFDLNQS